MPLHDLKGMKGELKGMFKKDEKKAKEPPLGMESTTPAITFMRSDTARLPLHLRFLSRLQKEKLIQNFRIPRRSSTRSRGSLRGK